MTIKTAAIIAWALLCCAAGHGQTSFQGLTAGASARADVERVLGKPVRTLDATLFEYKAPAGIAKVEVRYDSGSTLVEGIEVYFIKPISRAALLEKFKLPQQSDAKVINDDGKLEEFFGGQALLVMNYESRDAASGVGDLVYCSRPLFEKVVAQVRKGADQPRSEPPALLSGKWKGAWKNSKGERGTSVMNFTEEPGGVIKGDDSGAAILNGRRIGRVLTYDLAGLQKGCRDYKVQMRLSDDGHTLSGMYEVTDRCEKTTYAGTYDNYIRQ